MDHLPRFPLRRLIAAVAATTTTLALFSAVVAISEPDRSQLMAAQQQRQPAPAKPTVLAHAEPAAKPATAR
jgi:hypothetical protein